MEAQTRKLKQNDAMKEAIEMKRNERRAMLIGGTALAALPAITAPLAALSAAAFPASNAFAQASQNKLTRILVGFPPGQATDQVARLVAERLQAEFGQTFIVENKPGQGGSIALNPLARSTNDGGVISLSAVAAYVVNPVLYSKNVNYDSLRDFAPIAMVADLPIAHGSTRRSTRR